ncbi:Eco57I restriction-modification methylase domain-containing protein [uncultured Desulfosarcina sp.]|uniref:HsdM family class I SAM-dependent methyltransferase n=1 Tax=uncultured Desulfosarcina sp. TaxID=218289 RepID=UPI0029C778EE|nr:Eco57I restriction-modification methylase domain-containing protein [uncultured Desulfosarcina sp.]
MSSIAAVHSSTKPLDESTYKTLSTGRDMARAFIASVDPENYLKQTHSFLYHVVSSFWDTKQKREKKAWELCITPETIEIVELPSSAKALAQSMGVATAQMDILEACFHIGVLYTTLLPEKVRSGFGAYYTPPALCQRLLDMATEAGVDWSTCKALDPSCGGGAFLSPVARRMMEKLGKCNPKIALSNITSRLRGFEIDPFAAWMSQVFLELTLNTVCRAANSRLPWMIKICNSLEQLPEDQQFDLVIGNPPYGRITLSTELRDRYKRSLFGHANLYGVFKDLALRWTAPGGVIAYVTPTSFLAGEYFKALRALLANEAPPFAVDFVNDRKGVFEGVLQETLLSTYRKSKSVGRASVHFISVDNNGNAKIAQAGDFQLPKERSAPWLLPRIPEHALLIKCMSKMPSRLKDWGYKVSTGPLVWNRYKDQLSQNKRKNTRPLIWAESIASPGRFTFRAEKRNHTPYFEICEKDGWLQIDKPCVLLQRTTAKEQQRRLIAAELPAEFINKHGSVVVENHLNMIRSLDGLPNVSPAVVSAFLNSEIVDHAFRCISGSVAVSAFELENLPIPSTKQMKKIETLLKRRARPETIERNIKNVYLCGAE